MNDLNSSVELLDGWSEQFFQELAAGRTLSLELLEHQRQQLDALEVDVAHKIEMLSSELSACQSVNEADRAATQRQADLLTLQEATIARLTVELAQREADVQAAGQAVEQLRASENEEISSQREQLERRSLEMQAAELALRKAQRAHAIAYEELTAEQEQVARLKQRLEQQSLRLETEREGLANELGRTRQQRRRIARELQAERAARLEEYEHRKHELQALASRRHEELEQAVQRGTGEADELRRQLAHLRNVLNQRAAELQDRGDKLQQMQSIARQQAQQIARVNAERDRLGEELAQRDTPNQDHETELARLRRDCESLRSQLSSAQRQLRDQPDESDSAAEKQKREDLQRRFELAVSEIRELKRTITGFESQGGGRVGAGGSTTSSPGLDWAAQKQRLLQSLEDESEDDDDDGARTTRMTIEGTIRITDEVIAQKDLEIAELKELLDQQSANLGSVAVGAAAIAEILNNDELIAQQREKLRALEIELQEKLRQAEIDISLERAKNARDRAELEQRLAHVRASEPTKAEATAAKHDSQPAKSNKGRWLARLGLKDIGSAE